MGFFPNPGRVPSFKLGILNQWAILHASEYKGVPQWATKAVILPSGCVSIVVFTKECYFSYLNVFKCSHKNKMSHSYSIFDDQKHILPLLHD